MSVSKQRMGRTGTFHAQTQNRNRQPHLIQRRRNVLRSAVWATFESLEQRRLLAGEGVLGQYFYNIDFTGATAYRHDQQINFAWSQEELHDTIQNNGSVRWTGKLVVPTAGQYTFFAHTDDGVRLWINDVQIINDWVEGASERTSSVITLPAGQVNLKMEYFDTVMSATAILRWQGPGISKQIVPNANLLPGYDPSVPSGWSNSDIGAVGAAGSTDYHPASGTFTVRGSGADIYGTADEFQFARTTMTGDGEIIAHLTGYDYTDDWNKVGLMLRESDAANARFVGLFNTRRAGLAHYRSTTGGSVSSQGPDLTNGNELHHGVYWLKIARSGDTFTLSRATNPQFTSAEVRTITLPGLPATLLAGLAVSSHNDGVVHVATFDNVTVTGEPAQPPSQAPAITSVIATHAAKSVTLDFTDANTDESEFIVSRKQGSGGTWVDLPTPAPANATSYVDSDPNLLAGTQYFYRIRAVNSAGSGPSSNEMSIVTPAVPVAPTGLVANPVSAARIDLDWDFSGSTATGFILDRSQSSSMSPTEGTQTVGLTPTEASDTGWTTPLQPSTTYYYRVRAINAWGTSTGSFADPVTTPAAVQFVYLSDLNPTSVTNPYFTYKKDKSVGGNTLTIGGQTYDKGLGMHSHSEIVYTLNGEYDTFTATVGIDDEEGNGSGDGSAQWLVYVDDESTPRYTSPRRTGADGPYALPDIDITGATTIKLVTNTGGQPGDNDYKDHANWAEAKVGIAPPVLQPPATPANFDVQATSPTEVQATWSDVSDETGYTLQWSTDANFSTITGSRILSADATNESITSLTEGTQYHFRLKATNADGDSGWAGDSVTTPYQVPTIVDAPASSPHADPTKLNLSVLGATQRGESFLTYHWSVIAKPTGAADPLFSANATNAAKNSVATFSKSGSYTLRLEILNGDQSVGQNVNVSVQSTTASVEVTPSATTLNLQGTQQFSAATVDQFGDPLAVTWSIVSGGGSIDQNGLYTAPANPGSATVRATAGGIYDDATVTINAVTDPVVEVSGPATAIEGAELTYSSTVTDPSGQNPSLTYAWTVTLDGYLMTLPPGTVIDASTLTFTAPDDGTYVATLTVTGAGGTAEDSATTTVSNVAPTVTVDAAFHAPRNTPYPLSLTIEDPGDDHVLSWTVNWGDGSDPDGDGVVGQTIYYGLSASHLYTSTGSFDISITVTDDDGTYSVPLYQVSTHIEAPTGLQIIPISPTQLDLRWTDNSDDEVGFIIERQVNGGSWIEVHRTGSDVTRWSDVDVEEGSDYSYRVSTNDGSGIPGGAGGSGVPDGGGGSSSYSEPTDPFDPADSPLLKMQGAAQVDEGKEYTLTLSAANYTVRRWNIDWGDGKQQVVTGDITGVTHVYAQDSGAASYQIKVFAEDELGRYDAQVDGGSGTSLAVSVANVAPSGVSIAAITGETNPSAIAGSPFTILLDATDVPADVLEWTINWGDGKTSASNTWYATHTYTASGQDYTVTATVSDGSATEIAQPLMVNVPPDPNDTTGLLPADPSDLQATFTVDIYGTRIVLGWQDNEAPAVGHQFRIEAKTDDGNWEEIGTTTQASYSLDYPREATNYSFRVRASNSYGMSGFTAEQSVEVPLLHGGPWDLAADSSYHGQVYLSWYPGDGDFDVLEREEFGGTAIELARFPLSGSTGNRFYFTDTTATPGTTYTYRVLSEVPRGVSYYTDSESVTVLQVPDIAAPSGLTANINWTFGEFSWNDNSSNETGFQIQWRSLTSRPERWNWTNHRSAGANVTYDSYNSEFTTRYNPGTTYQFRVRAIGSANASEWSDPVTATSPVTAETPAAPSDVSAVVAGHDSINVTWTDNSNNESYFRIYAVAQDGSGQRKEMTGGADTTEATITNLKPNTPYQIMVLAYKASLYHSLGQDSQPAFSTVVTTDNYRPDYGDIYSIGVSSTEARIVWRLQDRADEYNIYRSQDDENYEKIATVGPTGFFRDTGLQGGTTYFYHVLGMNEAGEAPMPLPQENWYGVVTTPVVAYPREPHASPTSGGILIQWQDYSGDETEFVIQRWTSSAGWTEAGRVNNDIRAYMDTEAPADTLKYRVRAINVGGESTWSPSTGTVDFEGVVTPEAPSHLTIRQRLAQVDNEPKYVLDLVWADHADNETGFIVERSEDGGDTWAVLGDAATTTAANINKYTDETAEPETTYQYRVRATNTAGDSANTAAVTAAITLPRVSVVADVFASEQAGNWGQFAFTRTGGDLSQPLDVPYTILAPNTEHPFRAINGEDVEELNGTFLIPAGDTKGYLIVTAIADELNELTEILELVLTEAEHFVHGLAAAATMEIQSPLTLIDVDSNNDSGFAPDPHVAGDAEDTIEDDPDKSGKIIAVNDDDTDGDGVPDFADFDGIEGEQFVPVVLTLPEGVDPDMMTFQIEYDASDPAGVTRSGAGTGADPFVYSLPQGGSVRLWTRNGNIKRDAARFDAVETPAADTGYFVASVGGENQSYAMGEWHKLVAAAGGQAGERQVTLWAEAVRPSVQSGDLQIKLGIDHDGDANGSTFIDDVVRVTAVQFELVDARAFQPQFLADGSAALQDTDLRGHAGGPFLVDGAITDGASLLVLRTTPEIAGMDFALREQGASAAGDPWRVGSLWSTNDPLPSLPAGDRLITGIEQQSTSLAGTDGMAYYRPPNNFLLGSEMVEGTGIDVALSLGGNEVFTRSLLLRRPPLLLIHGIAGSPATFDANVWQSNVSPLNTVIHRVDYQDSNTKGYEDNFWKLKNTISATLADFRSGNTPTSPLLNGKKFAATRVDVAGHSMGGLITKWFIADWGVGENGISRGPGYDTFTTVRNPVYNYLRDDNFGAGDIRRFFSLGSPFLGSPLANALKPLLAGTVGNAIIWQNAADLSDAVKDLLFPTGDLQSYNLPTAIADLAEGSAANTALVNATYPTGRKAVRWHPLVGIAGREGAVMEDLLMDLLVNFAGKQGGSNTPLNFNTSDLVVHANSQRNGTGFGRAFDSHIHAGGGLGFFAEGSSPIMADWIRQLLTKNPTVTDFQPLTGRA